MAENRSLLEVGHETRRPSRLLRRLDHVRRSSAAGDRWQRLEARHGLVT